MIKMSSKLPAAITDLAQRMWFYEDPSKGSKGVLMPAYAYRVGKDASVQLKDHERRTPNAQRRILNKVFCLFIKGQSDLSGVVAGKA
jgi:hypothetical protein